MISSIISRLVILIFGTLYPAYSSYKAVNTKNVKEYVKWMMYWIVFALFTCVETFTDVFLSWFPFYYEIKIVIVIWFLSPATKGSSILYRKFVHPMLHSREQEIDEYIAKAKEQSYKQVLDLGSKGVSALMQTALKGGGGLVNQLRKSYSLSDINDQPIEEQLCGHNETESIVIRRKRLPTVTSSSSGLYFSEVDVRHDMVAHIHSVEDISSGYSSGEPLFSKQARGSLMGTNPLRSRSVRVTRSNTVPKKTTDSDDKIIYFINKLPTNNMAIKEHSESSSADEFLDTLDFEDYILQKQKRNTKFFKKNKALKNVENLEQKKESAKPPQCLIKSNSMESLVFPSGELRAGKYNKRAAPLPPPGIVHNSDETSKNATIKARLVLKPGVVRSCESSTSNKPDLFLPSSKPKSRSLSKSPVRNRNKTKSSLLHLMTIPRRLNFWHKDDSEPEIKYDETKRSSSYSTKSASDQLLVDTKLLSKSAEQFQCYYSDYSNYS